MDAILMQVGPAPGERVATLANIARNTSVKTEVRRDAVVGLCTYAIRGRLPLFGNVLRDNP